MANNRGIKLINGLIRCLAVSDTFTTWIVDEYQRDPVKFNEMKFNIYRGEPNPDVHVRNIRNSINFYYNPENLLIKKELTDSYGKTNDFWTFEYNEKNELEREIAKSETSSNSTTEYKYKDSKLAEIFVRNKTIGKESKTTFK